MMIQKVVFILIFFAFPLMICFFTNQIFLFEKYVLEINFTNYSYCYNWISDYLTIGSFMFAVQSFLIPFLKQSVYDSRKYIEYINKEYGENSNERYRPLCNLSSFLFLSTLLAFTSALLMFVFVFVKNLTIINLAFYCGTISFASLIISLFLMQSNFAIMFSYNKNDIP